MDVCQVIATSGAGGKFDAVTLLKFTVVFGQTAVSEVVESTGAALTLHSIGVTEFEQTANNEPAEPPGPVMVIEVKLAGA